MGTGSKPQKIANRKALPLSRSDSGMARSVPFHSTISFQSRRFKVCSFMERQHLPKGLHCIASSNVFGEDLQTCIFTHLLGLIRYLPRKVWILSTKVTEYRGLLINWATQIEISHNLRWS